MSVDRTSSPRSGSSSPVVTRLLARARDELGTQQLDAAIRSLGSALALAPGDADANLMMGVVLQMRGDHPAAIPFLRKALAARPTDAKIHMALGIAQFESGQVDAAIASLRRTCEQAPNMAAAWYNLGKALKLNVQTEQACEALRRATALDPSHLSARLTLADAYASLGEVDKAVPQYRALLQREPEHAKAWFALANLKTVSLGDDVARLQHAFERPGITDDSRILLGFALGRALEDQGDCASSFEVLRRANALQRGRVQWDSQAHRKRVDAMVDTFEGPIATAPKGNLGREVIFIVTLPRSGSTLVEQILASHPQVEGANEITDLPQIIEEESRRRQCPVQEWARIASARDWLRLGEAYLARTQRWRRNRPRFTDKNLVTWELVGAIRSMLPGARIVVCHRDPVETCLACFRQWFVHGTEFAYDLDEMADYCVDFMRLTRFWVKQFPDRVFDLEYETLARTPESTIRRLLEFCGLSFDPACLEFHRTRRTVLSAASAAQVRQPLHRDTARAERYGDKLDHLRLRLRDAGVLAD